MRYVSNNATDFELDMVNFIKCIGLSIVGLNSKIDKLQSLTQRIYLMMTALECRDVREF